MWGSKSTPLVFTESLIDKCRGVGGGALSQLDRWKKYRSEEM